MSILQDFDLALFRTDRKGPHRRRCAQWSAGIETLNANMDDNIVGKNIAEIIKTSKSGLLRFKASRRAGSLVFDYGMKPNFK
jgi:hypothetical protein